MQRNRMAMQHGHCVVTFMFIVILAESALPDLHVTFSRFHLLKSRDLRIRVKRNVHAKTFRTHLTFDAFGQTFQLLLTPGSQILTRDFTLEVVHGNGSQSQVPLDIGDFYHGSLAGDDNSWVSAVHDRGIWTILISSSVDAYYIEPLQNHDPQGPIDMMIFYNTKDVRHPNTTKRNDGGHQTEGAFCRMHQFPAENSSEQLKHRHPGPSMLKKEPLFRYGERIDPPPYSPFILSSARDRQTVTPEFKEKYHRKLNRQPRSNKNHDACDTVAVADYTIYAGRGKKDINTIAKFLISVYAGVDKIFRETDFGNFQNIRIMLSKMMIFSSDKDNGAVGSHLMLDKSEISEEALLNSMSKIYYFKFFCLAHLTTQRNFNGVLGLASRGNSYRNQWSNGICSGTYHNSRNIGLSTVVDLGNKFLPLNIYTEVVAHEIGHNFGAEHDKEQVKECSPSSDKGGKYLMWFKSSSVTSRNHGKFSPCSRKQISDLLEVRANKCLKPSKILQRHMCGNGVVDEGEECDVGQSSMGLPHSCCKSDCTLQEHAVCSPFNSPCCGHDCQTAPSSKLCRAKVDDKCLQETHCSGESFEMCPPGMSKSNGSPCGDEDECLNGECISACILEGQRRDPPLLLTPCACDKDRRAMCHRCCRDMNGDRICKVHGGPYHEGAPCLMGVCRNGTCSETPAEYESKAHEDPAKEGGKRHTLGMTLIGVFFTMVVVISVAGLMLRNWARKRNLVGGRGRHQRPSFG